MSVPSHFVSNAELFTRDLKRVSNMMDALLSQILTSERTAAGSMTTTTSSPILAELRQIKDYTNALERRVILSSQRDII